MKWNEAGLAENDLVFISGHPGRTSRLLTVAELEFQRDVQYPNTLEYLHGAEVALTAYSARSEENARRAKDTLYGFMNSRKARLGAYEALLSSELMERKRAAEEKLNTSTTRAAFERIAAAQKIIGENAMRFNLIESGTGLSSRYFRIARTLARAAEEREKPNGERLREFRDSNRESLELELFSEEPLYEDFERAQLAHSLTYLARKLGLKDALAQKILAGKAPQDRAAELVQGTALKDVKRRRELYAKDAEFFAKSDDPMIKLALLVDEEARRVRKLTEAQDEIKRQAHEEIAAARNALLGTSSYPDATFTLRLAFGRAAGFEENGQAIPFQTTFKGLYERAELHRQKAPFDLPRRWIESKDKVDLRTPIKFCGHNRQHWWKFRKSDDQSERGNHRHQF